MKNFSKITYIIFATSLAGIAHAERTWTGFYAGANAAYAFNQVQLASEQLGYSIQGESYNASSNFSSFAPGIQVGYLYQFSNELVSGIEVSANFNTNQNNTFTFYSNIDSIVYDQFTFKDQNQIAIKGRVGRSYRVKKNTLLPYITAGVSFANLGLTYQNEGGNDDSTSAVQSGLLVGAGLEWAFMQRYSLRAEYDYQSYGNTNLNIPTVYGLADPNGYARANLSSNNIAVAFNYWF